MFDDRMDQWINDPSYNLMLKITAVPYQCNQRSVRVKFSHIFQKKKAIAPCLCIKVEASDKDCDTFGFL